MVLRGDGFTQWSAPFPILLLLMRRRYGKCGSIEEACEIFSEMTGKNVFAAMTASHAMEGKVRKAVDLYSEMEALAIKSDHVTFVALLSACSHGGLVNEGYTYFNKMHSVYNIVPKIQQALWLSQ